MPETEIQH